MPIVNVTTSQSLEHARQEALCLELSSAVAGLLGKPEAYVQVLVSDRAAVSFGGSFDAPSAFVTVASIGEFTGETTKKLSAGIGAILARYGVPADRLYIDFASRKGFEIGWNNSTF